MSMKNDAPQGVPVPPEVLSIGAQAVGTGTKGTDVTLTVTPPNGTPITQFKTQVLFTGSWFVYNIGDQPPGTIYSATACYPGGEQSDPYVRVLGVRPAQLPGISAVTASSVSGTAQPGQEILAWRASDGSKIVDYSMQSPSSENFQAPYLPGMTLNEGDLLYLVSAYPGNGNMSPYDAKPAGYQGLAS
ncbi:MULTISPECIES: hypothetical protein [unclassified Martelella]|uniref:hypothetical protein n=1 Tax=unclassified Martelella TaxID=2629616 RepID=UPI0025C2A34C|nr:hypothetical protein [Martelella sp.]|tara:strand:- start:340 stop:903 length:564 start_codon:yes stop_codon:yes gene_type:complete